MSESDWIVILCGLGTFLIRWLPMRGKAAARNTAAADGLAQRLLRGIGPAAIAALLAVSFWPMVAQHPDVWRTLAVLLSLGVILVLKRCFGGIAGPTLAGAAVFGLLHLWLPLAGQGI
ncbi:AzlD domain-containing protein [Kerstersia gyiorum]|uniref:Branched-subunit amino acid transport protein AzlD n=1 Tax=Kerstersia gyiorum TaxID=206506 RepID=A0A4Q7MNW3_9BURK|nr:AzlD domain-containing protein [Kerstersia gyiorum]MCO7636496.1 AzlD domain-containing protein [Pseudomonas sp. S 311-6]KAB0543734.1 branched-chain amino acid transport [Kerstersia gyiorum]MCP1633691.1 branched-subunit amino acid transport protein AzlD [Kerstersia gyiorum]MCP1636941.1 branched-subunit amino acid transport protein AzlD [Kerstersia gyiorum]MCP1670418.1 branched-subunit amino acid transport protein AzlD [Kerstersia gyiorum]